MVTGLLPSRTGLYFLQPGLDASAVAREQPHLMDTLAAAGYHTMGAGKFVHGKEEPYFDEYGGRFGGFGPLPRERFNVSDEGSEAKLWDWGPFPRTDQEMPDWNVADWVIERLAKKHDKPFFLVAGFWRPHVPMYAPRKWYDLFPLESVRLPEVFEGDRDDIPRYAKDLTDGLPAPRHAWFVRENKWASAVQSYLASVAFMDSCVGRVLDAVDAGPYRENTIIVLLSDHGWHLGEKKRWAKRSLWTDGTRVPLIIAAPGLPANQVSQRPAGLIDLYPTLLELAGVSAEIMLDGQSLVPLLRDPDAERTQPAICTFGPGNHSLHFTRWHYIRYADGSEELYDLESDPNEWHSLADRSEHAERLAGYRRQVPSTNAEALRYEKRPPWEIKAWQTAQRNARERQERGE